MTFDPSSIPGATPRDEAALQRLATAWVRRRQAGLTPAEHRELERWLAADAAHTRAFAQADGDRSVIDWALRAGATDEVLAGLQARARRRRVRRQVVGSLAAAAAVAIGVFVFQPGRPGGREVVESLAPAVEVLQPPGQTLADGSLVELKDGAEIEVNFHDLERRVVLTRGTAHFTVAKDPQRPFVVTAGGISVRAVGTAFSVEFAPSDVTVLVTEGRVAVAPVSSAADAPIANVDAGAGVVVSATDFRASPVAAAELEERLGWRIPRLEFSGMPLREVVRTINRYNRTQLQLGDPSLGAVEVSGALRADKLGALVAMLESDFNIRVERGNGDALVLRAAK